MKRCTAILILFGIPFIVQASDRLKPADALLEDLDFIGALDAAHKVLSASDAQPDELVAAYRVEGLSLSALGKLDESMEVFKKLLSIDPTFQISPDISPKLAAPFYQAMAISREIKPISLKFDKPEVGAKFTVKLESDPYGLVNAVRLVHRIEGQAWHRAEGVAISGPGEVIVPQPADAEGKQVQVFFEALTTTGGVLSRVGSEKKPFLVGTKAAAVVAAADPVGDVDTGDGPGGGTVNPDAIPDQDDSPLRDEPSGGGASVTWYKTWWFWTAVGAVVVGTAVGVGVGVSSGGGGGSDRDYIITVP
jgi:hypothetical protein